MHAHKTKAAQPPWIQVEQVKNWRNVMEHRLAQQKGKEALFHSYRIRVAEVVRDYTESNRNEAPEDSKQALM